MRGLLLLAPLLSSAFALAAYLWGGGLWLIMAAFFIAGPLVVLLLALLLGRRADDPRDTKHDRDPRE